MSLSLPPSLSLSHTWCLRARCVTVPANGNRLVYRREKLHPPAELAENDPCVIAEQLDHYLIRPAAKLLQHLRVIPVVNRDQWLDAIFL